MCFVLALPSRVDDDRGAGGIAIARSIGASE
jgi:hypothetical protein